MGSNLDKKGAECRRHDGTRWKNQGRDKDLYVENRYSVTEGNKVERMEL